jgi:hypothetical protein
MTGVGDDSRGRLLGRPWFVVGLALALAATLALVLADDIRYLRLGIVAALWAALVGAFLAVKYRKQATSTEEVVAQAQEVYELELEREIAARREYELEIEAETRSRAETQSRAELEALRAEVVALRDSLQSLFGGEVLLERVALTAQATRMRALNEEKRIVESGSSRAQLTAAPAKEIADRPTELIERIREKQPARATGRPSSAPEPRRPERSLDLPPRRVVKNEPVPSRQVRGSVAANVAQAAAEARAEARAEQTRLSHPTPAKPTQEPPRPQPAELTRPGFSPSDLRRRPPEPPQPDPVVDQPTQLSKAVDAHWTPSWETRPGRERPVSDLSAAFSLPNGGANGATAPRAPEPAPVTRAPEPRPEPPKPPEPVPPQLEEEPVSNPTLPEEARRLAQQGRPGGRRRRAGEDDAPSEPAATGGRRRRADEEQPSWQGPPARPAGTHARPESTVNGRSAESTGRRAAVPEEPDSGSHSAGRSVSDLLAAHGATTEATPRRRRRAAE